MKLNIKDIDVHCSEYSDYVLSCLCNGDRYHVWLNRQTRELNLNIGTDYTTLFKNSVAERGTEGHFDCRRLKGNSKFAKELIDAMMLTAKMNNLFDKAEETQKQKRQAELQALQQQQDDRNRVYVLIMQQYDDSDVCGVIGDETAAKAWVDADKELRTYEVHILGKVLETGAARTTE